VKTKSSKEAEKLPKTKSLKKMGNSERLSLMGESAEREEHKEKGDQKKKHWERNTKRVVPGNTRWLSPITKPFKLSKSFRKNKP